MNKVIVGVALGVTHVGAALVGSKIQHKVDRRRLNKIQPLMTNALASMLIRVHTEPDLTAEDIREDAKNELAFIKLVLD